MTTSPRKKPSSSVEKIVKATRPSSDERNDEMPVDELVKAPARADPFDSFLPLVEAARHGGKTPQDLLQAATNGEIEVVFECPPGPRVLLQTDEPRGAGWELAAADPLRTPEYLVVGAHYCGGWRHRSVVHLSEAAVGYRKSHGALLLQPLNAGDAHSQSYPLRFYELDHRASPEGGEVDVQSVSWVRWVLWVNGASMRYPIALDDLLVKKSAFRNWMGWNKAPNPTAAYLPEKFRPKTVDLDNHDFLSPQLLRMCEAAHKFWGCEGLVRDNPRTYPSEDAIIEFFTSSDPHFSGTAAKEAARLIKPRFAQQSGPRPK